MADTITPNLIALLDLCIAWGADEAIEEAPLDRLTASPRVGTVSPPPAAVEPTRPSGWTADTIDQLRVAITAFEDIGLRDTATGPVLFEGDPASGILFVLPPPSLDEDRAGRLCAGETGAFLSSMLASIGLRERALLAPLIPWRPPGDRPPSTRELAVSLPFLYRLIALSRPRVLVVMGALAERALLTDSHSPPREMPMPAAITGFEQPVHCLRMRSAAQLRSDPAARPAAWAQLRTLHRWLDASITQS